MTQRTSRSTLLLVGVFGAIAVVFLVGQILLSRAGEDEPGVVQADDALPPAASTEEALAPLAGRIEGIVLGADGTVAEEVELELRPEPPGDELARTRTDAAGRFAFDALDTGTYTLSVDGEEGEVSETITLEPGEARELELSLE